MGVLSLGTPPPEVGGGGGGCWGLRMVPPRGAPRGGEAWGEETQLLSEYVEEVEERGDLYLFI